MEQQDSGAKTDPLEGKVEFDKKLPQSFHKTGKYQRNQCNGLINCQTDLHPVSVRKDTCTKNTAINQIGRSSEMQTMSGRGSFRMKNLLPDCEREPSDVHASNNGSMEQEEAEDNLSDADDSTDVIQRKDSTSRAGLTCRKQTSYNQSARSATNILKIKTEPGLIMECEEQPSHSEYTEDVKSESSKLSDDIDSSERDLEESHETCRSGNSQSESIASSAESAFVETGIAESGSPGVINRKTRKKPKCYVCLQCDAIFSKSRQLNKHMKMHAEGKSYICELCDTKFMCPKYLKSHMLIHAGHKPYACQHCDAKFARSNHLKSHMLMHTGEKPHACNLCEAKFTRASNLRSHRLVHDGQRPHVCPQCDAKFTDRRTLKRHILIHTGHKPHVCQQCGAKFTLPGNLRQHELTHTGQKSHACNQCDAKFTRSYALKKHMSMHEGLTPHACDQCDAKFACSAYLKKHMARCSGVALRKDSETSLNWYL